MRENRSSGVPTSSSINWPVQSQKQASSLKFRIQEEKKLYNLCSSYCKVDLHLCFRIGKNPVFSGCGSNSLLLKNLGHQKKKTK